MILLMSRKCLFVRIPGGERKEIWLRRNSRYGKIVIEAERGFGRNIPIDEHHEETIKKPGEYIIKSDINEGWSLLYPKIKVDDEEYWKNEGKEYYEKHIYSFKKNYEYPGANKDEHDMKKFDDSIKTTITDYRNVNDEDVKKEYNDDKILGWNDIEININQNDQIPVHWGKHWKSNDEIMDRIVLYLDSGDMDIIRDWSYSFDGNGHSNDRHVYYCGFEYSFHWMIHVDKINGDKLDNFKWLGVPFEIISPGDGVTLLKGPNQDHTWDKDEEIMVVYRKEDAEKSGLISFPGYYFTRKKITEKDGAFIKVTGGGERTLINSEVDTKLILGDETRLRTYLDQDVFQLDLNFLPDIIPGDDKEYIMEDIREQIKWYGKGKDNFARFAEENGWNVIEWLKTKEINWNDVYCILKL